ncbi:hypothetical protein PN290_02290 [Romboutsia sp. 1001216sp1]|uniref:hypothetical protein n=1 Tax=Romboutsia TaxID=1501226 RepID=UPI000B853FAE|nr:MULTISPECIES: hypothetical protein [Romboutsia]MDB8792628.1 hypothetical protein [Romboutsia sp. 1001216sp1]MDB8796205.1 hypothetical protein [Romboutsia sp. 1001216sp1]MDB8798198.1 hypothetical protein [Romboutsia sp. 1001216sp1]
MSNIKNDCNIIQNHIKKSKSNLSVFMYTTNAIMFMLMTPFVKLHEKHFNKVEEYVSILNDYCKENNLDIKFDNFYEVQNSSIMYSQTQLGSLTIKQYEARIKYLNTLNENIESLKGCI